MIQDDGIHLAMSAGDPQLHPGPQCRTLSRPLRPSADHGPFTDWCAGCFGEHPVVLALAIVGVRLIPPHTPSPPQFTHCGCGYPLQHPSYTNAGHPWCGDDTEAGLESA